MVESRNFYLTANDAVKDLLLDFHERYNDIAKLKRRLIELGSPKIDNGDVREALVMSYSDSGESEKAIELATQFNERSPSANMHNLIIKTMLSSWQYSQQGFLEESQKWAGIYARESDESIAIYGNDRPRIGLVCDYGSTVFGANAIFPMAGEMIKHGLDVFYYNFERRKYHASDNHLWVANVHDLSSQELSELIRRDRIDILIDLNGRLREHHRLGVFCRRSAPIQINYFNLVGTMGMKSYDYMIVDEVQVPVNDERFFTEKPIRLPCGVNGAFAFERDVAVKVIEKPDSAPFLFASFNAFFKCNDVLLRTWAEILRRVPNSRLLIKCHETGRDRVVRKIAKVFSGAGVELDRVLLEGWTSLQILRRQYEQVDLCLDTFPYSGGSTTLNALWQAAPVLTWCGDGWRSRSSASMLNASSLTDFIAFSREDYVEKAVSMARDRRSLYDVKRYLESKVQENLYFQPGTVYAELSDVFKRLCSGTGNVTAAAVTNTV